MVITQDLPARRDEKTRTKNIEVHFRTAPGDAQERIVVLVGHGFTGACDSGVVQRQSCCVITEADNNVNQANTGLVRLDNSLCNRSFALQSFKSGLYCAQLVL